mmetsp:Transcript_83564/g.159406  ORF Transcript_83564/g.159406 Transcript_83564/m.159406 type:complete len:627 (+) Transcript_83564:86-1966(+)
MVGPEVQEHDEPVDILGNLASRAASRLSKQRNQRQRPGQRLGSAAAGAGKRISVAELRARGVDEAFLAPAPCVDAAPVVQETPAGGSAVVFVAGQVTADGQGREPNGQQASDLSSPSAAHSFNLSGAASQCSQHEAVGSRSNPERHWSSAELNAEYGIGYKLLAGMGYQAGAGRVPLAAVKRQYRAALQDDEAAVLDHSFSAKKKPRRKRVHRGSPQRVSVPDGSESLPDAVAAVETLWAQGAVHEGAGIEAVSESEMSVQDSGSFSDDEEDQSLRGLILSEVRQRAAEHIPLAVLATRPRIRRALADRPECGKKLHSYIQTYIQEHVQECHVRRSLAPGWLKLSSSSSMASWGAVTRKEFVVALRKAEDDDSAEDGGKWDCWESSSDDEPAVRTKALSTMDALLETVVNPQPSQEANIWHCHSCEQTFSRRVALREHVQERLIARTTSNPTDLTAPLDAEHRDREALQLAAKLSRRKQENGQPASEQDVGGLLWHCPACSWTGPAHEVDALLAHACSAPAQRVAHQRFLSLLAELLIAEPPPPAPPCSGRRAATSPEAYAAKLESWAASAAGFTQLFKCLASSSSDGYRQLEAEKLGPLEDDIFGAAHLELQSSEPFAEEQGIFV